MNHQKQSGFILLLTLLFIQLCTLLSLYMLKGCWIDNKLNMMAKAKQSDAIVVENQMYQIEREIENSLPACLIDPMLIDKLKEQPLAWWEQNSCRGSSELIIYYYVIEPLSVDECAEVYQKNHLVAYYYRLTFLSINKNNTNKKIIQTTFVKAVDSPAVCEKLKRLVDEGRQSWSEMDI